jgi:hypothetical protein
MATPPALQRGVAMIRLRMFKPPGSFGPRAGKMTGSTPVRKTSVGRRRNSAFPGRDRFFLPACNFQPHGRRNPD